jgi:3-deoxy-D-manno-octulosonic-acid transferase
MDKEYRERAAAHFIRNHGKKLYYAAVSAASQEVEDAEIDASSSSRISRAKEKADHLMAASAGEWAASLPVVRALRSRDGVIRKRKPGANKPAVKRVTF